MNQKLLRFLIALQFAALGAPALADPDKDESGHGHRYKGGEYKEEFWDGDCKIERKWERKGEYKEEVKCERPPQAVREHYYEHDRHPGGAAIIIQPPSVTIEPPAIVIR